MGNKGLIIILAIIGYLIYFFSPIDLIPDVTGIFGKLDDFALLAYLIWLIRKWRKAELNEPKKLNEQDFGSSSEWEHSSDPYQILGISRESTEEEIRQVYKKLAGQYHPDKVSHLGKEFQELANKKFVKIQWAYKQLIRDSADEKNI